jgi:hypothetical protein
MAAERLVRSVAAALALAASAAALGVTVTGDPVPHLWHSFNTPDNAFLGAAGYTGPAWRNTDAGALYAEWGGFIPDGRNSWTFSTPTVGTAGSVTAVLNETSGTGLLTGTGNIYGLAFGQLPGPPLIFNLVVADTSGTTYGATQTRTIVLRSGTLGTLPDMNVRLNGNAAAASANTFRIDGTIDMPTGPGGAPEPTPTSSAEWLWRWENVPATGPYRFDFQAQTGHMSLDNLVVYASPPSALPPPAPVPTARAALLATNALASQLAAVAAGQTTLAAPAAAAEHGR